MFGIGLGRRRLSGALGCAVVVLTVSGCGGSGGGGIPADASVKDFCKAGQTFAKAHQYDAGVKAATTLHDTGTPKGIPSDARSGFELVVGLVTKSKDQADLERRYKALTASQRSSVTSLDTYITKTC